VEQVEAGNMAFLDFLNQPIGGYNTQVNPSTTYTPDPYDWYNATPQTTGQGVTYTPKSNITWGQLAGVALQQSNNRNTQMAGKYLGQNYNGAQNIYQLPTPNDPEKQKKDSTAQVLGLLANLVFL
jgi:hypothetical protein